MRLKAGIQAFVDLTERDFLDTGLRRCDETFFNSRLGLFSLHRLVGLGYAGQANGEQQCGEHECGRPP